MNLFSNWFKSAAEKRQEQLSAYVDGQLSRQERQRFERDLAADAALRHQVEQQRLIKSQLSRLPRRRAPRNFTLEPSLYGRPGPQTATWLYPTMRTATALAAFFFVLAVIFELAGAFLIGASRAPVAMEAIPPEQSAPAPPFATPEPQMGLLTETTRVVTEAGEMFAAELERAESAELDAARQFDEPAATLAAGDMPPPIAPAGPATSNRLEATAPAAAIPTPDIHPPLATDLEDVPVELFANGPPDQEKQLFGEAPAPLSRWRIVQGALGAAVFILALITLYLGRRTT
jgi:hypothetical protein